MKENREICTFGPCMARVRKASKLSQSGLAKELGITTAYVSLLERGERAPSYELMEKICESRGIKMSELVKGI